MENALKLLKYILKTKLNTKYIPLKRSSIQFNLVLMPIALDGCRSIMVIPSLAVQNKKPSYIDIISKIIINSDDMPVKDVLLDAINQYQTINKYSASIYIVDDDNSITYYNRHYLYEDGKADESIIAGITISAISSITGVLEYLVDNMGFDIHKLPASHELNTQIRIPASP